MGAAAPTKGNFKMKCPFQTMRSDFSSPKLSFKIQTCLWKYLPEIYTHLKPKSWLSPKPILFLCAIFWAIYTTILEKTLGTTYIYWNLLKFLLQMKEGQMNLALAKNNLQTHLIANPTR